MEIIDETVIISHVILNEHDIELLKNNNEIIINPLLTLIYRR